MPDLIFPYTLLKPIKCKYLTIPVSSSAEQMAKGEGVAIIVLVSGILVVLGGFLNRLEQ
jgi:hypothetical protein